MADHPTIEDLRRIAGPGPISEPVIAVGTIGTGRYMAVLAHPDRNGEIHDLIGPVTVGPQGLIAFMAGAGLSESYIVDVMDAQGLYDAPFRDLFGRAPLVPRS